MIEIIITICIVLLAAFIIRKNIKNSKSGNCGCSCENCSKKDKCH